MRNDRIKCAPPRIATRDTRRVLPPPKIRASIYGTAEFAEWRAAVIRRSGGFCQDPACANPLRRCRLYADHPKELRDGGEPFNLANGMARCGSCHQRKTLAERAKRMGLR
jgi:5-methylcytosine-specific restriction enzyme A